MWYNKAELKAIKQENEKMIQDMNNDCAKETRLSSKRGLECRTKKGGRELYYNRRQAIEAVLNEQDHQEEFDAPNEELLASIYQLHANKCQMAAYVVGLTDATAAQNITSGAMKIGTFGTRRHSKTRQLAQQLQSVLPSAVAA